MFTLLRKRNKKTKVKKSSCPYKLEPSCGESLEKRWGLYVKQSVEGLKHVEKENIRSDPKRLNKLLLIVVLMLLLISLIGCGGKVILLKEGDMSLLENGNYSVSPAWMEERLNFENDMVKRLQECNSN